MQTSQISTQKDIDDMVREFILDGHPCVMAQSVVKDNNLTVHKYKKMDEISAIHILKDLELYLDNIDQDTMKFQTFIAVFKDEEFITELEFEKSLWKLLNTLHKHDTHKWDNATSSNPNSENFSFSLLANSFYIVGMHPNSSRLARSSPLPMIVFNLHSQFDQLRELKRFKHVKKIIRRRDKAYQGSINPMLEDFGTNSEARQYSGRNVGKDWKCPFSTKEQ